MGITVSDRKQMGRDKARQKVSPYKPVVMRVQWNSRRALVTLVSVIVSSLDSDRMNETRTPIQTLGSCVTGLVQSSLDKKHLIFTYPNVRR